MSQPSDGIELPNPVICAGNAYKAITDCEYKEANAWAALGQLISGLPHTVAAGRVARVAVELVADPENPELRAALDAAVADYLLT